MYMTTWQKTLAFPTQTILKRTRKNIYPKHFALSISVYKVEAQQSNWLSQWTSILYYLVENIIEQTQATPLALHTLGQTSGSTSMLSITEQYKFQKKKRRERKIEI